MKDMGGDGQEIHVSADEYRRFCEFLYRRTGLFFAENRRYFVDRRLIERMKATGAVSVLQYLALLQSDTREMQRLTNAVTVNETYFYREEHQLACLTRDLLPDVLRRKHPSRPVRIWSIPCSTGEEPYSLAIWMLENWDRVDEYDIEIVGSDIDTTAVQAAKDGIYGERALMRLPPELVQRYFARIEPGSWRIASELRDSVRFTQVNVVDAAQTSPYRSYDVIFCRNMLIYFDERSRREAADNLFECLCPGGYVCLGHTESMSRISPLFEVARFADAIVYRKPLEAGHG